MKLLAIAVLSDHLMNAIGSTLLHSLWQGLILVGLTGLIIIATRSCKPSTRYNLLVFTLFSFFAISVITFVTMLTNLVGISVTQEGHLGGIANQKGLSSSLPETALLTQAKTYLADHNNTLVLIWFLIVGARCIQLFIGLNNLNHIRKNATFNISVLWDEKVKSYAKQLGIKRVIRMAECGLVRVPMVIGHLKPLILIPIGLFTALQPKEIEAILVHELAHIYRRDYVINLLQSMMEILFFFNPAVLWLSSLIKAERENCCDDVAVKYTSNKVNYISALIACQEYQQVVPAYAMTFSRRGGLRNRVHRLVANTNTSLTSFEKSILAFCMVTASLILIDFGNDVKIEKMMKETTLSPKITKVEVKQDTLKHQNCLPEIKIKQHKVSAGVKINSLAPLPILDTIHHHLAIEDKIILDSLKALSVIQKINAEKIEPKMSLHAKMARIDSIRSRISKKTSGNLPQSSSAKITVGGRVKEELIIDGIITKSEAQTSFMLSEKELIVNGKKQPEEIHQKYKNKYVPVVGKNEWVLYYNFDNTVKVTAS